MVDTTDAPRPVRMCDVCGGVDDHPRHVHATPAGQNPTPPHIAEVALENAGDKHRSAILAQILDTSTMVRHLDCCASFGCPDGSCNAIHAATSKDADGVHPANDPKALRGQALLDFIQSGKVDHVGANLNAQRSEGDDSNDA